MKNTIIGFLIGIVVSLLYVGNYVVSIKLLKKESCKFIDFLLGFNYYKPLIIFYTIQMLISDIEYIPHRHIALYLLIIMATMLFFMLFLFTPLLIVDRHLGFWRAMELSRKTVQGRLFGIFIFIFFGILISGAGIIALGVGILVALPVVSAATAAAYADLFGLQSQEY